MKTEIELDHNFVSDLVAKELQELYEFTREDWFDEDPEEAREALSTVLFYYMNPAEYRKWRDQKRNLAAEVVEGFDHLEKDEVGMIECGTCGYPLLPEERTSLVERNGKMVKPWVWITDDDYEVGEIYSDEFLEGVDWAEAKLKEKNT